MTLEGMREGKLLLEVVAIDNTNSSRVNEESIQYDFLPHEIGVGMSDLNAVFKALQIMGESNATTVGIIEIKVRRENLDQTMKWRLPSEWDYVHIVVAGSVVTIMVAWDKQSPQFNDLSVAEEAWSRQKSRIMWLDLRDNITSVFHKKVASHRMRNKILSICDELGNRLEDPQDVKKEILRFYMQMLGTTFDHKRPSNVRLRFAYTRNSRRD
ncbi:hypothetical protein Vadar_025868 [Vaccinium darrowii]|uniref:Uncharacterized protein n=1 Tax=Vaccinium darrowii TaxID=229202 RepID=A0ACB7X3S2_9ERIC|nr:hypothetical protein Vadar_025868 [Vaccinium darrowii]